jgi:hypothetical protein
MSETKDEIAAERDDLKSQLDVLRAENATLRQAATANTRPANPEPRFELSAGEQAELQTNGFTRSVRDSSVIVASDFPHLVDVEQMTDAARAASERELAARDKRAAGRTDG